MIAFKQCFARFVTFCMLASLSSQPWHCSSINDEECIDLCPVSGLTVHLISMNSDQLVSQFHGTSRLSLFALLIKHLFPLSWFFSIFISPQQVQGNRCVCQACLSYLFTWNSRGKKVILSLLVGHYITKALTSRIELAYSVTLYVLKNLLRTLFSYLEQKRILRIRIIQLCKVYLHVQKKTLWLNEFSTSSVVYFYTAVMHTAQLKKNKADKHSKA